MAKHTLKILRCSQECFRYVWPFYNMHERVKKSAILRLMDKVNLGNILLVSKAINNLVPPIFNNWCTFVSAYL